MPAPLGNQYAVGNPTSGRPSHFDKHVEAEKLLAWAKTEEALVLRMFAPLNGYSFDTMTRWAEEDEVFCQAYKLAKDLVGARRELLLIKANSPSPFQRYATYYDNDLKKHERDEKAFEASLKNEQSTNQANEAATTAVDKVLDQIKDLQASSSAKKIAETKRRADSNS